ncbi:FixG Ig-like domain-containing protein [Candidatus Accumulibacter contiguus]|uniref:FixG Ig-like domain-containing protein n=1 Tax=Candidatus Accumulibacter contiguus TaxID=2954381 RepID=UPI002FC3088F
MSCVTARRLSREADDGRIENVFRLHISNTDEAPHRYSISVSGIDGIDIVGERRWNCRRLHRRRLRCRRGSSRGRARRVRTRSSSTVRADNHEKIAVREKDELLPAMNAKCEAMNPSSVVS